MSNMIVPLTDGLVSASIQNPATEVIGETVVDAGNFRRVQGILEVAYANTSGGNTPHIEVESSMDNEFKDKNSINQFGVITSRQVEMFNASDEDSPDCMYRYLRWVARRQLQIPRDDNYTYPLTEGGAGGRRPPARRGRSAPGSLPLLREQ